MEEVGNNIRKIRERKGYTLKQIAERSELSIGFISQVERNQTEPSLASLKRLAMALGVKTGDLFEEQISHHQVTRKGEGKHIKMHSICCEVLASPQDKMMEAVYKHIQPCGSSGMLEPHEGEEFVWVLKGQLRVVVDGEVNDLFEGDSIYFKAKVPHSCANITDEDCDVLWVTTPPLYT